MNMKQVQVLVISCFVGNICQSKRKKKLIIKDYEILVFGHGAVFLGFNICDCCIFCKYQTPGKDVKEKKSTRTCRDF